VYILDCWCHGCVEPSLRARIHRINEERASRAWQAQCDIITTDTEVDEGKCGVGCGRRLLSASLPA
jgi:hypothetical protein